MKENEFRRQAEAALNEELGISSKKALPHEYHAQYDALLEAKVVDAEKKAVDREKLMRPIRALTSKLPKLPKMKKNDKDKDPVDAQANRRHSYMGEANIKHPNQQKLDVHEPEKDELTAKDFEMLRSMGKKKKQIDEKAVSQQQQKFFGLVNAIKKGKAKGSPEAEEVAKEMSAKEVRKFAKTKHEGLPKRVDEAEIPSHKQLIDAHRSYFKREEMDRSTEEIENAARNMHNALSDPEHPDHSNAKKALNQIMKESVIDEIRRNLEENLMAIHESGDEELFENYVNSLTEEELDILGLNEDWRASAFGDNTSGGTLSNAGYRTPPSVAAAQARGAARPAPRPASAPVTSAPRPASTSSSARPAPTLGQPQQVSKPGTSALASKGMQPTKISVPTAEYGKTGPIKTGIAPKLSDGCPHSAASQVSL